jgi:HEAT repeat protein
MGHPVVGKEDPAMRTFLVPALCLALLTLAAREAPAEERKRTVEELIRLLDDPDKCYDTKLDALRELEPFGAKAEPAIPALLELLPCDDPEVQAAAVRCLQGIGKPAVPALARAMKRNDEGLRDRVAEALEKIGPDAKEAVPALLEWLASGDDRAEWVILVLPKIGAEPEDIIPAAVRIIKRRLPERDHQVNCAVDWAVRALADAGPAAREAVPILIEVIEGYPTSHVRSSGLIPETVAALAALGAEAEPALPALRKYLSSREYGKDAEQAIARIKAAKKKD